MTPTEELMRAADKLDELSGAITPCLSYVEDGHVLPEDSAWFELVNCPVGKALALVLREAGETIIHNLEDRIPHGYPPIPVSGSVLDLARLINGGAS